MIDKPDKPRTKAERTALNSMAASATLHCLTGCAIGEILGLMIGTAFGLSSGVTITLAVGLAFLFGYALSTLPLIKAGLHFFAALSIVFAADTLSITTMEIVDNAVMAVIPGAMNAGLVNPIFWLSMMLALIVAYVAAFPVNRYLLGKGRGHALTHQVLEHGARDEHGDHGAHGGGTKNLAAAIIAFMLGGLVVSIAAELDNDAAPHSATFRTRSAEPAHRGDGPERPRPVGVVPEVAVAGQPGHRSGLQLSVVRGRVDDPPVRATDPATGRGVV